MLTHQVESQVAEILAVAPVARTTALLRPQTVGSVLVIGSQKPMHLAAAEPQQLSSPNHRQAASANFANTF
jgi:hypothetical protein